MAQRVEVHLIDDLDGETAASQSVAFALDGVAYEIDLADKNADKLRKALAPFIAKGRRTGKATTGKSKQAGTGPAPTLVRAWAKENGYDVPDRGRIPKEILEAYQNAH
jgi:hypothetical protein